MGLDMPEDDARMLEIYTNIPRSERKPKVATGVIDYFPDAIDEIALVSEICNEQHNPGTDMHWDRAKSQDEANSLMRHFKRRGTRDADGQRHTAKVAWRACAMLQKEIEDERAKDTTA
jgi:hypothetical protein